MEFSQSLPHYDGHHLSWPCTDRQVSYQLFIANLSLSYAGVDDEKYWHPHLLYGFPDSNNTHMSNVWSLMVTVTKENGEQKHGWRASIADEEWPDY